MSLTQLNYDNINLEDYSEEVREQYAFPQDKQHLYKIMRGERLWSRQDLINQYNSAQNDAIYSTLALTLGAMSFALYTFPAGKVMRDRYNQSLTPSKRLFRRFWPFAGIAFPIYMIRQRLDSSNGYKD